jgi:polyhydroxyalkanoate synthesis regulator phasin
MGGKYGRSEMADKKLSAYDVLSQMCGEDLIVALKSLGEGKYQNANIKLAGIAESLSKLSENVPANNDLSNLTERGRLVIKDRINAETNQRITNVENTKANVNLSNVSAEVKAALTQNSITILQGQINALQSQVSGIQGQVNKIRERVSCLVGQKRFSDC